MTDNEKRLVESIVKHDSNVLKLQKEIKENFGLESEYNTEDNVLKLKTSSITESLTIVAAKDYVYSKMPETEIFVKF